MQKCLAVLGPDIKKIYPISVATLTSNLHITRAGDCDK